jgi:hypothetical protein
MKLEKFIHDKSKSQEHMLGLTQISTYSSMESMQKKGVSLKNLIDLKVDIDTLTSSIWNLFTLACDDEEDHTEINKELFSQIDREFGLLKFKIKATREITEQEKKKEENE